MRRDGWIYTGVLIGCLLVIALMAGCTVDPGPQGRVILPSCLFMCDAAAEEGHIRDSESSSIGGGAISQTEQVGAGQLQ